MGVFASQNPLDCSPVIINTNSSFLGSFLSLALLQAAHPNPADGSYANIINDGEPNDLAVWNIAEGEYQIFEGQAQFQDQDNIPLLVTIASLADGNITTFVTYINTLSSPLVIGEKNSVVQFKIESLNIIFQLVGIGKGTYGSGQTQIAPENVLKYEFGTIPNFQEVTTGAGNNVITNNFIQKVDDNNYIEYSLDGDVPEIRFWSDLFGSYGTPKLLCKINETGIYVSDPNFPDDNGAKFINGTLEFITPSLTVAMTATGITINSVTYNYPSGTTSPLATESYVNDVVDGIKTKQPVRVATTANIALTSTQTIDGVVLSVDDRVLVKDQTLQENNGIYLVKAGAWVRANDANNDTELVNAVVSVLEGTVNGNSTFRQTSTSITLGTSNIVWVTFGTSVPDASPTTKGKAKLYADLLASNTDGSVTQAALVAKFGLVDAAVSLNATNIYNVLPDRMLLGKTGYSVPNQIQSPANFKDYSGGSTSTNFISQGNHSLSGEIGRVGFTTASTGDLCFRRRNDLYQLQNTISAIYNTFRFVTVESAHRFVYGFSKNYQFATPSNISPTAETNFVGICKMASSSNLHFLWNDASGTANTEDSGYPCLNSTNELYYIIAKQLTSSYEVTIVRYNFITNLEVSRITKVMSSDIPDRTTGVILPVHWGTKNGATNHLVYADGGFMFDIKN